ATWEWYVALAASVVATVDMVAARGHVIGDLAPDNLFVTADAHVAVVDVDGWQLARPGGSQPLPCPFSRPEYTAPAHLGGRGGGHRRGGEQGPGGAGRRGRRAPVPGPPPVRRHGGGRGPAVRRARHRPGPPMLADRDADGLACRDTAQHPAARARARPARHLLRRGSQCA